MPASTNRARPDALAVGERGSNLRDFYRWDLASGKLQKKYAPGSTEGAWFLPGHSLIAVARRARTVELLGMEPGNLRKSVETGRVLASNERYLVSATYFLPLLFEMKDLLLEEKQAPAKP